MIDKWDNRFLRLAEHISGWSKDPSTQTGAVIVDTKRRIISTGYNGFPQGVEDRDEWLADRETKYALMVHCEMNAILFARQHLGGCTLYTWPFLSCRRCATVVIQSGITRCVAPTCPSDKWARWGEELDASYVLLREAGLCVDII